MNTQVVEKAYKEAQGSWITCDWTTSHGTSELNLEDESPENLRLLADKLENGTITDEEYDSLPQALPIEDHPDHASEIESDDTNKVRKSWRKQWLHDWIDDLRSGADWLEQVENDAEAAEEAAKRSIESFREDDYETAIMEAEQASRIEGEYGDDPVWG